MTQPRPTHEVFRPNPSKPPSYDKFVPAKSVVVERHIEQPVEEHVPDVDRLDELRREDHAYLNQLATSQRQHALEQLETEIQERELFRRARATVKRRVNVAHAVRGRVEEPLIGSLGLAGMIRKKRAGNKSAGKIEHKNGALLEGKTSQSLQNSDDTTVGHVQDGVGRNVQHVELVSGYESSSDDEERIVKSQDAACERTERSDRD